MKCSVSVGTSLDGFIARADGSIDRLDEANALVPSGDDLGDEELMAGVDELVMGRNRFEHVVTFGEWPHGDTRVVLPSRSADDLPTSLPAAVSVSSLQPDDRLLDLAGEGVEHVYVDGGRVVQSLLRDGLVDEMSLTIVPILTGDGVRLFGSVSTDIHLEQVSTRADDFGFVQHNDRVRKEA
jgi:dihydrofolate reductase